MKRLALRALYATLFAGGLTLLGAGVAHASETNGDDGILSGSQVGISIELPVTVSGNAISVIGDSQSSDASTAVVTDGGDPDPVAITSGEDGIGSGTQALIDVSAPVTIGGNAISVIGDSQSSDATTVVAPAEPAAEPAASGSNDAGTAQTSGEHSILGGTQLLADVVAPITVSGNAISVIGDSTTDDAHTWVATGGTGHGSGHGGDAWTSGEHSILGGTQLLADVVAPITVSGNAISVIGDSTSTDATTVVVPGTGGGSATTDGSDGLLGGTQLIPNLSLPITIGGNAISVIGDSETDGSTTIVVPTDPTHPTDPVDPTDPTDPVDPTDPTDPVDPTHPGHPGTSGGGGSTASASGVTAMGTSGTLAHTGAETAGLWLAGLLLLGGALLLAIRRFAPRRFAPRR